MTRFSVVIATCGGQEWADLAWSRAYPSAQRQLDADGNGPQVVIEHYPELTVSGARNAAAANADRDWLIFLDADDELGDSYVCEIDCARGFLVANNEDPPEFWPTPPLLVPAVQYVRPTGTARDLRAQVPNLGGWPRVNECVIGTAVRRDLFEQVGGFRSHTDDGTALSIYEDYDFFLRCFDIGAPLVYAELSVYRAYLNATHPGRNQGPNAQAVYDAIWKDHLVRVDA